MLHLYMTTYWISTLDTIPHTLTSINCDESRAQVGQNGEGNILTRRGCTEHAYDHTK